MGVERTYLDYNATAPLLPEARDAMVAALDLVGNPSSVHRDGRAARALIDKARGQVAALVGAEAAHVTFTSGATEAASHVLTPDFRMGRAALRIGKLYVSAVEHPCVLEGGRFAKDDMVVLPVDGQGRLDLKALDEALADHDAGFGLPMVAVMLANNESGVVQPIAEIAPLVQKVGGILVVDAVQAVSRMSVDMTALGADFLILSAHKIGGPKGVGALVSAGETMMPTPLIGGGGQEKGHRSGTENMSGIVGFGAAAHISLEAREAEAERLLVLRETLEEGIRRRAPDAVIVSEEAERLANTTFFAVPGLKAETMQIAFDLEGISLSAGSACSSGKVGESHVLKAMGLDAGEGAIRVSTGAGTDEAAIERFLGALEKVTARRAAAA
jgi:cysteine desulfurase